MTKPCIICGTTVTVNHASEIVVCESNSCIHTVETNISIHYSSPLPENYGGFGWPEKFANDLYIRNNG